MSFQTSVDTMNQSASGVDDVNAQVQAELARLRGVVESVAGVWRGEAQVAFQGLMQRWDESARELSQALDAIAQNIRANASSFDSTEMDNAAAFKF